MCVAHILCVWPAEAKYFIISDASSRLLLFVTFNKATRQHLSGCRAEKQNGFPFAIERHAQQLSILWPCQLKADLKAQHILFHKTCHNIHDEYSTIKASPTWDSPRLDVDHK